jgi:tetratricopeptide (TPR) repeat protein
VELDPKFGIGYQGLASMAFNLGKRQDAESYMKEALRHVDAMTERERYNTRGLYYFLTGDHKACVREYGDLVARYPVSPNARSNLALCLTYLREMPRAVDEMRRVVEILPNRAGYRTNLALYAGYATDFQTAEKEARAIQSNPYSQLALAFAQLGQGQLDQAADTYRKIGAEAGLGASLAASGLGDLAVLQGRYSDAVRILEEGAAADLASKNPDRAAAKFAAIAHAQALRRQTGPAVAAASRALANSQEPKIRFLAARTLVQAGELTKASDLAAGLAGDLQPEPQAYGKIVQAEIALNMSDARQAVKLLIDANALLDTWMGHFDLGLAYLELSQFAQADAEFDRCLERRGEALALFLDEEPTFGYLPPIYYYQGRAREGMKSEGFSEWYRTYLEIRGQSIEDSLLGDARRRAGQSGS